MAWSWRYLSDVRRVGVQVVVARGALPGLELHRAAHGEDCAHDQEDQPERQRPAAGQGRSLHSRQLAMRWHLFSSWEMACTVSFPVFPRSMSPFSIALACVACDHGQTGMRCDDAMHSKFNGLSRSLNRGFCAVHLWLSIISYFSRRRCDSTKRVQPNSTSSLALTVFPFRYESTSVRSSSSSWRKISTSPRVTNRLPLGPSERVTLNYQSYCFSRFLCLPLVCAVSVLHILCLWWLKLSSQWKNTHTGYKVLSHHVSVWSLIPQQW